MTESTTMEMTEEEKREFEQWLADRPQVIKKMVASYPPTQLYRHKETGQVFALQAYNEDGTVRAYVLPEYSGLVTGGCSVFGIDPKTDLEPATQAHLDARKAQFAGMTVDDVTVTVIKGQS